MENILSIIPEIINSGENLIIKNLNQSMAREIKQIAHCFGGEINHINQNININGEASKLAVTQHSEREKVKIAWQ